MLSRHICSSKLSPVLSIASVTMFAASSYAAVLVNDPFNYAPGSNLGGQGGWINVNSGDEVVIMSGSLPAPAGFPASSDNSVMFGGAGADPARTFTPQTTAVYFSFLISVSDLGALDATGGYLAGLGATSTSFGTTVWTRSDVAGAYQIGLEKRTTVAEVTFAPTLFAPNDIVLVVGNYVYGGATNDDVANIWINPPSSSFGGTEPAPTLTDGTGVDLSAAGIERFFLRQDSATETPAVVNVDELRVGNSYAEVTMIPEPGTGLLTILGAASVLGLRRRSHAAQRT